MLYESTYQAAGLIAPTLENHFARHFSEVRCKAGSGAVYLPDANAIEWMIDAAFWASLRKEEGHSPRISMAFLPPGQVDDPLLFEQKFPLEPAILTKLAPGLERPGIHLGVWYEGGELYLWGTTLQIPDFCFVLDVSEPALLVVKHRRMRGFGKYTNVAVLKGDQINMVDETQVSVLHSPPVLSALLDIEPQASANTFGNILVQLAVSMRAHAHGGALLIVPSSGQNWRGSIIHPIQYSIGPSYKGLMSVSQLENNNIEDPLQQNILKRQIEHLAGLTAVDGATILNDRLELLAFGVKIGRREGAEAIERVALIEPIAGTETLIMHPAQLGGTRHLSAAQFIHDQKDAQALVASQDDHFTVFSWSPTDEIVQAFRIETLLL